MHSTNMVSSETESFAYLGFIIFYFYSQVNITRHVSFIESCFFVVNLYLADFFDCVDIFLFFIFNGFKILS